MRVEEASIVLSAPSRWFVRVAGGLFCLGLLILGVFGFVTDAGVASTGLLFFSLPLMMAGVAMMVVGWRMRWWDWAVLLAGGFYFWRAAVSPVPHLVTTEIVLLLAILGAYMAGRMMYSSQSLRVVVLWSLVVLQLGQMVLSIWQWAHDQGFSVLAFLGMERPAVVERVSGFAFHPNVYGAVCAMLLPWFLAHVFLGRGGGERFAGILGFGVSLFGLALSFSRAALLGAIGGLAVFFVLWFLVVVGGRMSGLRKWVLAGGIVALSIVVAVGVWMWLPKVVEKRFGSQDIAQIEILHTRDEFWNAAFGQFLDAPMLGHGARSYSYLSYEYWPEEAWAWSGDPVFVHNEYYQLLTDYGLVGLLVFVLVAGILVVVALVRVRLPDRGKGRAWVIGGIAALAAVMLDAVFSFTPHHFAAAALIALLVGGMVTGGRIRGESLRVGVPIVPGVVLLLLGGVLFWLAVPLTRGAWIRYSAEREFALGGIEIEQLVEAHEAAQRRKEWYDGVYAAGVLSWIQASQLGALGDMEGATGWMKRAEGHFAEAVRLFPEDPVGHLYHGQVLGNLGRFEEGDAALSMAWRLGKRRDPFLKINLARANHYRLWAVRMMEQQQGEAAMVLVGEALRMLYALPQGAWPEYAETLKQTEALAEILELIYGPIEGPDAGG